jgi:4-amino-4-deoxy-L-arabinose transferase-like glycosyltransferase
VRRPILTLLLLCAFTFFLGLGRPAITDSDEAFYAEASREMVESGDWLTPHFNYEDRWQKPVLYYWLTAATYRATGPTEWAARVWSALSGLGLVMLTWSAGRTMTARADAGWLAGVIVATCFGYFAMARAALPDLPLTFCITLGIWAAMRGADRGVRWWALAGLADGLGFLLKGPVALVIPALVLLPIAWRERGRLSIRPSGVALAIAIFTIVGLPWYGAMLVEHGTAYAQSFFVGDNFERFATGRFNDPRPFWFYVPVVLGGMLPWSAYLVALFVQSTRDIVARKRRLTDQKWRLLIWAGLPLLFYTLSIGKQPRYILPILPPLAVLLASSLASDIAPAPTDRARTHTSLMAATWATAALLALMAILFGRMQIVFVSAYPAVTWTAIVAIGLSAVAVGWVAARRAFAWLPGCLAATGVVLVLGLQFGALSGRRPEAVEEMATQVRAHRLAGERIGVHQAFVRNLIFYTGLKQEDLFNQELVIEFLRSPARVLLVLPADEVAAIEATMGVRLNTLAEVRYFNSANVRLRTMLNPSPSMDVERVALVTNR